MKTRHITTNSLRERKFARTKVALMQAFVDRMRSTRFEDISIRDVCQEVEVSEGTFFNYFPRKIDVIYYYNQLATIHVVCQARQSDEKKPLAIIEAAFASVARMMDSPYLLYEMISLLVGEKKVIEPLAISALEKKFAFSECDGIEQVDADPMLRDFFELMIGQAAAAGALPKKTNKEEAVVALDTILVGVPLALTPENFNKLGQVFKSQLALLWKALRN